MTTDSEPRPPVVFTPPRATVDGERLIAVFSSLVEPLGRALPGSTEVVLHDLSKLPDSIVAVHGDVTGRHVGQPATDLLLERVSDGELAHQLGYETRLPNGRRMKSSTMIIRDISGYPVAALCINTDISSWLEIRRIADSMLGAGGASAAGILTSEVTVPVEVTEATKTEEDSPEAFPRDVDELAAYLLRQAIAAVDQPVDQMKKDHKLDVVAMLQKKGFFMLKNAVEMVAQALDVTRFTIYNYLNELAEEQNEEQPA